MKTFITRIARPVQEPLKGAFPLLAGGCAIGAVAAFHPAAGALLAVILATAAIVYVRPSVGVYLSILAIPFLNAGFTLDNKSRVCNEFFPLAFVPIIFTAALFFARRMADRDRPPPAAGEKLVNASVVLILAYAVLALSWTRDPVHGANMILALLVCFWIPRNFPRILTEPRQVRTVMGMFFFLSFVLIALLLLSKKYHEFTYTVRLGKGFSFDVMLHTIVASAARIRLGGFAPVNIAANILTFVMFVDVYFFIRSGWKPRALLAVHALVVMYCIFKTGSKAGLFSLIFGLVAFLLMVPEYRKRILRIGLAGSALLGVGFLFVGKAVMKRIELIASGKVSEDRLEWWAEGFRELWRSWGLGVGTGGFPKYIDPVPAAHSFYFSVLFEFGLIGFLLFGVLVFVIMRSILKDLSLVRKPALRLALYCFLGETVTMSIHALVDADYNYLPLWMLFGLMLSVVRMERKRNAPDAG